MNENKTHRRTARHLAEQLVKELRRTTDDPHTFQAAIRLRDRLRQPTLAVILNTKVAGESIAAKCRTLGISRQTYYTWAQGVRRPSFEQALRLAEVTGIMVADVRRLKREDHHGHKDIHDRDGADPQPGELRVHED
jgi:transcriptional regulator with XRE-family HTH domain